MGVDLVHNKPGSIDALLFTTIDVALFTHMFIGSELYYTNHFNDTKSRSVCFKI